jgi:hypothetical protein
MRVGTYTQLGGSKWSQQPRDSPVLRDSSARFRALSAPLLFSSRSVARIGTKGNLSYGTHKSDDLGTARVSRALTRWPTRQSDAAPTK